LQKKSLRRRVSPKGITVAISTQPYLDCHASPLTPFGFESLFAARFPRGLAVLEAVGPATVDLAVCDAIGACFPLP
jgi:hypothetical protein